VPAPGVIVFSAYASPELLLPARLAKADGVLNKGVGARELFETIRGVAAGERLLAPPSAALLHEAHAHIAEEDRMLIGMLLDGATENEAARTLNCAPSDVRHIVQRTLSALRRSAPVAG
jgi:DNA-binding NarL/FixJ family response regulator